MNCQNYFDCDILIPAPSFIAIMHYKKASRELYLVLRSRGQRYVYKDVPVNVFCEIFQAQNKGPVISQKIIHSRIYEFQQLEPMPLATLEQRTMPRSKKYWLQK